MKGVILDLAGGTGSWSADYKKDGFTVRVITLPYYDIHKTTYTPGYVIFKGTKKLKVKISDVFGIFASPVCTMFSFARSNARTPRDLKEGMRLVIGCLNIIWECRYNHKLAFWCLENPMGYLRQFLGKPVFTFDPCDFGDPYTKKTDLWGYFNIPKGKKVEPEFRNFKSGKRMSKMHHDASLKPGKYRRLFRSITPPGFAKAFFEYNRGTKIPAAAARSDQGKLSLPFVFPKVISRK